jgi:hypothetical protein
MTAMTVATWSELKTRCESGGCTGPTCEVFLSDSFDAGSYPWQIDVSGKTCVVSGNGKDVGCRRSRANLLHGPDEATSGSGSLTTHNLMPMNGKGSINGGHHGGGGVVCSCQDI